MELRDRILDKAAELFFQEGVKSVTMTDVAKHLGISKRTLYEQFKDKDELVSKCVEKALEDGRIRSEEHFASAENVLEGLLLLYRQQFQEFKGVNRNAINEIKKFYPKAYVLFENHSKSCSIRYNELLAEGQKDGLIREDVNLEIVVGLLQAQFMLLFETDHFQLDKYTILDYMRAIIINFLRGISTKKGIELIDSFNFNRDK